MKHVIVLATTAALLISGCGDGSDDDSATGPQADRQRIPAVGQWNAGAALPAEPQLRGDPERGRDLLLNGAFMTCGIPYKLWENPGFRDLIAGGFGGSADFPRIPNRSGNNAGLPYFLNVFEAPNGAEVVNANCLLCHGGQFDGELVVGLGNANADSSKRANARSWSSTS